MKIFSLLLLALAIFSVTSMHHTPKKQKHLTKSRSHHRSPGHPKLKPQKHNNTNRHEHHQLNQVKATSTTKTTTTTETREDFNYQGYSVNDIYFDSEMLNYQAMRGFKAWNTLDNPDLLDYYDFYEINSYNSGYLRQPYMDEDAFNDLIERYDSNNDYMVTFEEYKECLIWQMVGYLEMPYDDVFMGATLEDIANNDQVLSEVSARAYDIFNTYNDSYGIPSWQYYDFINYMAGYYDLYASGWNSEEPWFQGPYNINQEDFKNRLQMYAEEHKDFVQPEVEGIPEEPLNNNNGSNQNMMLNQEDLSYNDVSLQDLKSDQNLKNSIADLGFNAFSNNQPGKLDYYEAFDLHIYNCGYLKQNKPDYYGFSYTYDQYSQSYYWTEQSYKNYFNDLVSNTQDSSYEYIFQGQMPNTGDISQIQGIADRAFAGQKNCVGGISIWILYEFFVFASGYYKANPPSVQDCYDGAGFFYHYGSYSVNSYDINYRVQEYLQYLEQQ